MEEERFVELCSATESSQTLIQSFQPYIVPHFPPRDGSSTQDDFRALLTARWSEYRAEQYLQSSGNSMESADEIRINTPVQLFLAHSRMIRARLELRVYGELLEAARPALLKGPYSLHCLYYLSNFDGL